MADDDPLKATASENTVSGSDSTHAECPDRIGRYEIKKLLGKGGFGVVYLVYDEQLDRLVALKLPHAKLVSSREDADPYLAEARTVANLDHPHIVPVHDVGSTEEFPCYVICKYVQGCDLSTKLKQSRLTTTEAAGLVATLAEALHYAHKQGVVHRDIKPGNILIGNDGTPYIVDFGLALREENIGKGARYAGTPGYMSPEQARGEGHRVDGRSDVFSLGAVLYELLVGRPPFRGDSRAELLEQVSSLEPRPIRQYDDQLPKELERICDKALAKRLRDRYLTAKDFADDLRHSVVNLSATREATPNDTSDLADSTIVRPDSPSTVANAGSSTATGFSSSVDSQPLSIVPKGLRSFDAHDADFFLELLPGSRDRNGLPDSLRFWKTRIEETDPEATFPVGLIYGPSGCGKSSFVKAGLIPRLSSEVIAVYVEATADKTETRLLHNLRGRCAALDENLNLQETFAALRRGQGIPAGKKVLIVLDQFEQWLHVNKQEELTDLAQALRQCDGSRLQCVLMVRDDFWLAASRFMGVLEVDLRQGRNSALTDLFDLDHARRVLAAFGRAFGQLPEWDTRTSKQQKKFLKQAVSGLAEDGKVICLRLALFAEMMKGKLWTTTVLQQSGGTLGVGVTFLEETFSASTSHPKHRLHQQAARDVLRALLPDSGSDIKGPVKSYEELLEASGYARRLRAFDELIKLLDSELRLITPTEAEQVTGEAERVAGGGWRVTGEAARVASDGVTGEASGPTTRHAPPTTRNTSPATHLHYQLTHDYLVPALREWLTRKQQETRRGRAELSLSEFESVWRSKPEVRHLPPLWEYLRIAALTAKDNWSESQRKMMRRAARVHGLRWGSAVLVALVVSSGIAYNAFMSWKQDLANRIEALANSRGAEVQHFISELDDFPERMMRNALQARCDENHKLPLAYALAKYDAADIPFLVGKISAAPPEEVENLVVALGRAREEALRELQLQAKKSTNIEIDETGKYAADERLQAVGAIALPQEAKEAWQRKARLAMVAMHLEDFSLAKEMCQIRNDPIQRVVFIKECETWHGDLERLATLAQDIEDPALRSALCSVIGGVQDLPVAAKAVWTEPLKNWFEHQPDKITHSAAGWALRAWHEQPPRKPDFEEPSQREWYVLKTVDLTMLKIPAASVARPVVDPDIDPKITVPEQITVSEPCWLADHEVSVGMFRQFVEDDKYHAEDQPKNRIVDSRFGLPTDSQQVLDALPVSNVSWSDAILFCNWLSIREDLQPCYERTGDKELAYADRWRVNTRADGYRLPTEMEWKYACQAGCETRYPCGDDDQFLHDYAVYRAETSGHVPGRPASGGSKLPNAWGLFDMYGNVWEWCYPTQVDLDADVFLGGAYDSPVKRLESLGLRVRLIEDPRFFTHPELEEGGQLGFWVYGFRVARSHNSN